jgi:hypothetical protein
VLDVGELFNTFHYSLFITLLSSNLGDKSDGDLAMPLSLFTRDIILGVGSI